MTSTNSWVYLFSKFTAEALLFEALAITLLSAGYAAFWILRKRQHGVIQRPEMPSGVVKGYLNELIFDAEQLRAQLFGLLASTGVHVAAPAATTGASTTVTTVIQDPEILKKVSLLEGKMAEQAKAMDSIVADKARIEKELQEARTKGGSPGGPDPMVPKLQEKIQSLEGKLAEYSIIEDDLANLKRLQQENAQLKSQLAQGAAAAPAPVAAAPAAPAAKASAPKAAAPAPAPQPAEVSPLDALTIGGEAPAAPLADAAFEGLVDQVEDSLKPSAPAASAETAASAPAAAKSDEDLVAEFEKMLSG